MVDYDGEYNWSYDGNRDMAEGAETPDGMEEHKSSNPNYKKESEKTKVNKYKQQDFP